MALVVRAGVHHWAPAHHDLSQEPVPDSQGEPLPGRRDPAARERPHQNADASPSDSLAAGTGREREPTDLIAAAVCLEDIAEREGPLQAEVAAIRARLLELAREAGGDA